MTFKKYLWKCRLLVLNTPNYSHPEYKRSKELYQKDIKGFHKRYIKLITKLDKSFAVICEIALHFDADRDWNIKDRLYFEFNIDDE